jgi:hypothetical protein
MRLVHAKLLGRPEPTAAALPHLGPRTRWVLARFEELEAACRRREQTL